MFDANELRKWSEQLKSSPSNGQQSPNTNLAQQDDANETRQTTTTETPQSTKGGADE